MNRAAALALVIVGCGRSHFDPCGASDARAVDVTTAVDTNFVFVTSTRHGILELGNDALTAADAICSARASEAGLPGTYVAWLSVIGTDARNRLGATRGWRLTDGRPFADQVGDVVSGRIVNEIAVDEHQQAVGVGDAVYTGTRADGTLGANCANFTTTTGLSIDGSVAATSISWTENATLACASLGRFYCFGIGKTTPLSFAPASGRRAFVSVQTFAAGNTALAAADALCNSEANAAGLTGSYRALLATTSMTAISRFSLGGPTWVRLDGVPIADSALAFAAGNWRAPLNVSSASTYVTYPVYSGAFDLTTLSQDANEACANWTDPAAVARIGAANHTDSYFAQTSGIGCNGVGHVYCLEE